VVVIVEDFWLWKKFTTSLSIRWMPEATVMPCELSSNLSPFSNLNHCLYNTTIWFFLHENRMHWFFIYFKKHALLDPVHE
jgi:hypothetical protein